MPKRSNTSQIIVSVVCVVIAVVCYLLSPNGLGGDTSSASVSTEKLASADSLTAVTAPVETTDDVPVEVPATSVDDVVISHTGYELSYNSETNCPNWVAWELTGDEARAYCERYDDFQPDPDIAAPSQVTTRDYSGSGYTRGHMCPAADMRWSAEAQRDCFYMSNMCPQLEYLNTESWEELEKACRQWAKHEGSVYIVCGPVFDKGGKTRTIGRQHKVRVPDGFFKVVLSLRPGHEKAIGFYYAHNSKEQTMAATAMSVDDVEKMTGYDFFPQLSSDLEGRLESVYDLSAWK